MIAYIKGAIVKIWENSCIVLTGGGVGYEIYLPAHTLGKLPDQGSEAAFYTSMIVREDAQELYGFETFEEKQTFEILVTISKIGARTALAIISSYRPDDLQAVVRGGDIQALTKISGIGQKTAQHIMLELKYKLKNLAADAKNPPRIPESSAFVDTLTAMLNLGYDEGECAPLIREIFQKHPDMDAGGAIKLTLKALAKGKS